jgi:hypothetical protein
VSDLEDRLRAELRRRAASVDPSPELPQRIDARVRRRARQRRMMGSAAVAGAMIVLGGGAAAGALLSEGHTYTRVTAAGPGPGAGQAANHHHPAAHRSARAYTTSRPGRPASSPTTTTTVRTTTSFAQSAPPASQAPLPECTTAQLAVRLYPAPGEGRAGHFGMMVVLLNASSQPCVVRGYVGLGLYDAAGNPIPSRAVRGPTYFRNDPGPHPVVLQPGGTASTDVSWSDLPASGTCEPPSATLEVTPPNQTTQLKVALHQIVCGYGDLHTTALVAGSSGPR